ncbi:hypothetical protein [Streptomyces sp. ADI95-16]|uniref:hypothetical protein n=1 Tax=Streptomyces sp. ADI95-16 TaxID=1522758 RepID=UPI00157761B8|nr:hypothetical protein [Streptomyces sp. ADI95-16]
MIKKSAGIALRRSPAMKVGASVRRRAAAGLASGRSTLVDSVLMPAAQGSAARVQYAAVLDGHTLNLRALLPAGVPVAGPDASGADVSGPDASGPDASAPDASGPDASAPDASAPDASGPDGDAPARAHVLFISGGTRIRAAARLHRERDGQTSVQATVLLGEDIGGVPVTLGRWTLGLELDSGSPAPVRLQLIGDGAPAYGGPTRPLDTCVRTGRRHRLGLTPAGRLRLTIAPAVARAEVLRVNRAFTGTSVLFAVYGPDTARDGATPPIVELVEQQRRTVLRHTAEPLPADATAWRVTLPLGRLLDTSARQTWSLRVVPGPRGGKPLEIGRHGHDLRSPRKVLTPPKFTVRAQDGTFVEVKPQYTRRGALQLVCTPRKSGTP